MMTSARFILVLMRLEVCGATPFGCLSGMLAPAFCWFVCAVFSEIQYVLYAQAALPQVHLQSTVVCLSFGPIENIYYVFCDLSVRENDWRSRARAAKAT